MAQMPALVTPARIPLLGTLGSPAGLRSSEYIWRTSFVNGEASQALAMYIQALGAVNPMATLGTLGRPKSIVAYSDGSTDSDAEMSAS